MSLSLESIYKAILATGWLVTNENGEVLRNLSAAEGKDSKNEVFIMLDKQVALPTRENLNRSGRDNLLIFHPLMEGLVGGESPIIGKLRRAYGIRMTFAATSLFKALLAGATHTTEYNKFSPSQMRLFKTLSDISEKTLKQWDRLARLAIEKHGATNAFVDVYTNRNAMLGGQPCSRVTTVRFPMYEELVRTDKMIFGKDIQLSTNDRANFRALFEFAFPGIENKDQYSYGTNSRIAPYLDALLGAFGKLFKAVNGLYDEFSPVIVMEESIHIDLDWPDWFDDIESLKTLAQSVPQQYGNYAVKVEDEKRQNTDSIGQMQSLVRPAVASIGFPAVPTAAPPMVGGTGPGIGGGHESRMTGYDQVKPTAEVMVMDNGVAQPHLQASKFTGIGKPLMDANGVVQTKQPNLEAVIISNSQSRVMVDPASASIKAALDIVKQGGVGRVSAAAAHPVSMGGQFGAQVFGNQPLNSNMGNTGGWANSTLNTNVQNPNLSAAMLMREVALQRIMSDPSPFSTAGSFNRGSVI